MVKPHDAFSQLFAEQRILDMTMMPKSECLGNRSHAQKPAYLVNLLEVREILKNRYTCGKHWRRHTYLLAPHLFVCSATLSCNTSQKASSAHLLFTRNVSSGRNSNNSVKGERTQESPCKNISTNDLASALLGSTRDEKVVTNTLRPKRDLLRLKETYYLCMNRFNERRCSSLEACRAFIFVRIRPRCKSRHCKNCVPAKKRGEEAEK